MQRGLWMAVAAGLLSLAPGAWADPAPADVDRFVKEICLNLRVKNVAGMYLRCDAGSINLSFHGGTDATREHFRTVGESLNQALTGSGFRLAFENGFSPNADVLVFLDPESKLLPLAQQYGFPPVGGASCHWITKTRADGVILKGVICLDAASFAPDRMDRQILRYLLSTLGTAGYSSVFPDSVFAPGYSAKGKGIELTPLDKVALRFALKEVRAGMNEAQIDALVAAKDGEILAALAQEPGSAGATASAPPAATP